MIQPHAPDRVGELAQDASAFASVVAFNLLAAKSAYVPADKRKEAMERLFFAWPALCKRMAALERAAPNSARAGAEQAARVQDFIERRDAERQLGPREDTHISSRDHAPTVLRQAGVE